MIVLSLLFCLAPVVIAFILISILWPDRTPTRWGLLLKLCLAVGIGLGLLSCIYFLQLSLFGASRRGIIATQIALLAIVIGVFFYKRKYKQKSLSGDPAGQPESEPADRSGFARILSILLVIAFVAGVLALTFISLRKPHGAWDAWAVY